MSYQRLCAISIAAFDSRDAPVGQDRHDRTVPPIYHFTHGSNLLPILGAGAIRAHALAGNETVADIAEPGIKAKRAIKPVPCDPGSCVGNYVPFYFAPRSPMLYSISRGNVTGVDPDQAPIVYLVSSTERVTGAGLSFAFSDGNAATAITEFSNDTGLLATMVDWPLMEERYWRNTPEDGDRVRRRMAEFLVLDAVPIGLVDEVAVFDLRIEVRVREILHQAGIDLPVAVRRDWYF